MSWDWQSKKSFLTNCTFKGNACGLLWFRLPRVQFNPLELLKLTNRTVLSKGLCLWRYYGTYIVCFVNYMFQVGIVETKQKQNFIEQYNYKQGNSTMVLKTTWCIQFIWFNVWTIKWNVLVLILLLEVLTVRAGVLYFERAPGGCGWLNLNIKR